MGYALSASGPTLRVGALGISPRGREVDDYAVTGTGA